MYAFSSGTGVCVSAYRDKKVVGVFVRFSCAASVKTIKHFFLALMYFFIAF
jgi:hypothetical protein